MSEAKSWIEMKDDEWIVEKRTNVSGLVTHVIATLKGELEAPADLVEILIKGGAHIMETEGWE